MVFRLAGSGVAAQVSRWNWMPYWKELTLMRMSIPVLLSDELGLVILTLWRDSDIQFSSLIRSWGLNFHPFDFLLLNHSNTRNLRLLRTEFSQEKIQRERGESCWRGVPLCMCMCVGGRHAYQGLYLEVKSATLSVGPCFNHV